MEMPWESTPRRSVSTIMSAVVWACGALMPQAASTETSWRCRASALTWAGMARLRRDVAEELLRRVGAPLAHEPLLHGEEVRSAPRVQPIGVGPALVHPAPGIAPVVVHLAAEEMPAHAPHVLVLPKRGQILVVLEHRVHVRHLEGHVVEPGAVVHHAEERVVVDVLVAAVDSVERADDVVLAPRVDVIRADEAQRLAEPGHRLADLGRAEHTVADALDGRGRFGESEHAARAAEGLIAGVHL